MRFPLGLEGQEDRLLDCLDVDRLLQALTTGGVEVCVCVWKEWVVFV